ncbi:primase-like DNA-binding domain-containing protein [Desemzia sp. FAM 24101]|uniref:primase-like DNA-binding domain-containing protein n=1 Tax=unclassified Desemzia TaxID=2685243 RepID=UPI0038884933
MEYFIKIAVEGLKRVLDNNKFTTSKRIDKEVQEYELSNNPLLGFIQHCEDEELNIVHETLDEVYIHYGMFCDSGKYMPLSKSEFSKQLQKELNIKTIRKTVEGKKRQVFIADEE